MSDFLLENEGARRVIKALGLPLPLPQPLERASAPYEERPLAGEAVVVGGGAELAAPLAEALCAAGAEPYLAGAGAMQRAFSDPGEAYGRPPRQLDAAAPPEGFRPRALVFDACGLSGAEDLRALYDFFHPLVGGLERCGRVVVLARPPERAEGPDDAAARAALEGFVRSLAKEIGRRGSTANLLYVEGGAEDRLAGPIRFLLSRRSAFVSGQPIRLSAGAAASAQSPWVRSLEGKVALVTGAARGIGEATARLLAGEGAYVVCLDRPEDDAPLSVVAREIGGSVLAVDVTSAGAPAEILGALSERHGGVDIVVHNAGVTRDKTLARMDGDKWDQALAVNLAAVTRVTRALLDGGLRDGGRVVCLSSVAGIAGNMGQTNYAASKAGLIGFVRALSRQLGPRGITVNAVAPGFIETRLTRAIPVVIREVGRRLSAVGQGGIPRDVAEAITFLSTPGASGITGQVMRVCGGAFIGA